MARAVVTGDGPAVAKLWEVPALVVGDEAVIPVSALSEVEQFFGGAKEQYNASGITDTRPEIVHLEWATPRIALVEVRWPYLDAEGRQRGSEISTYAMRRDITGALKLRAAIMHGASEGAAPM
jgi:hypothetical protein